MKGDTSNNVFFASFLYGSVGTNRQVKATRKEGKGCIDELRDWSENCLHWLLCEH